MKADNAKTITNAKAMQMQVMGANNSVVVNASKSRERTRTRTSNLESDPNNNDHNLCNHAIQSKQQQQQFKNYGDIRQGDIRDGY